MKNLAALFALCLAASLFAATETYDDLGEFAQQETEFWNTKAHPSPVVDAASTAVCSTVETRATVATADEPFAIFDSRVFTSVYAILSAEFSSDPLGSFLIIR